MINLENLEIETNKVNIAGKISTKFSFDHELFGEKFFRFNIETDRFSGTVDTVPCLVSERIIDVQKDLTGTVVVIEGSIRTYNKYLPEKKSKLILNVFVKEIEFTDIEYNINEVTLDAYICKEPVYRKTPTGREIADVLLAVNRPYTKKSDYIPCITWGRNARFISHLPLGTRIAIKGRLQSRDYFKKISEDETVVKTTYEVSIGYIKTINTPTAKEEN